jgi:Na+/melibiose symporter-like transporter
MAVEIVVAVVGGCFSLLVALIYRGQKENRQDHGRVHEALGRIEQKIDHHTENHP